MQNVGLMPGFSFRQRIVSQGYRPVLFAINSTSSESVRFPPQRKNCGWKAKLVQGPPFRNLRAVEEHDKPEICTADELHYVAVPGTAWRLALWRYLPSTSVQKREHPVLMLSGIGTNAIGFDLDSSCVHTPEQASLARHVSAAGFDTWILEVRGAGLSKREGELVKEADDGAVQEAFVQATIKTATKATEEMENPDCSPTEEEEEEDDSVASRMTNRITQMSHTLRTWISEGKTSVLISKFVEQVTSLLEDNERLVELRELAGLLDGPRTSSLASQVTEFSNRILLLVEEGQRSVSPSVTNLQERLATTISDFQEVLELIDKYDWDFDTYLEEDVPAAMEYVVTRSATSDGKVLGVGHSMGGILLYAMLASRGERAGLAGAVALASSLDYAVSDSSLKKLLPLTDPAQMLHVPAIPLGALMNAIHPLSSRPPYALAYLGYQVSAHKMMDPALFKKLVCNNFCTVPVKLLLQLATVFKPGGLQNRTGAVMYKDRLHSCDVPVLAIAGDGDLICPPVAVTETLKAFPQSNAMYKVFGGEAERHYGHYDLLCALSAQQEVYPVIMDFLFKCDKALNSRLT